MKDYKLIQTDKFIYCKLPGANQVISTGVQNGGIRQGIRLVFNHDCKPAPGEEIVLEGGTYESHLNFLAEEQLGVSHEHAAGMMTSAQMKNASIRELWFEPESGRDAFFVKAVVTAGIDKNGSRAGEDACWHENRGVWYHTDAAARECACEETQRSAPETQRNAPQRNALIKPEPGTINILLFIGAAMTPGALARVLITATEAKCAAIQDLNLPSIYSDGIATGSGTDGIIAVCDEDSDLLLTEAGTHTKVGELIGKTVKQAVKEALFKQTGVR